MKGSEPEWKVEVISWKQTIIISVGGFDPALLSLPLIIGFICVYDDSHYYRRSL